MQITVFYSWQSDLPTGTNRAFIEKCLKDAIKTIDADDQVNLDVTLDRDTLNASGSVDIAATIYGKIDKSDIFVGDVTAVGQLHGKKSPNANVLVELGYAAGVIGWEGIICVCNTAHGEISELPFDIRGHRMAPYCLADGTPSDKVRSGLAKVLEGAIKDCNPHRTVGVRREVRRILAEAERLTGDLRSRLYDDQYGSRELPLDTLLGTLAAISSTVTPHLVHAISQYVTRTFHTDLMHAVARIDELAAHGYGHEEADTKTRAMNCVEQMSRLFSEIRDRFRLP